VWCERGGRRDSQASGLDSSAPTREIRPSKRPRLLEAVQRLRRHLSIRLVAVVALAFAEALRSVALHNVGVGRCWQVLALAATHVLK
jgi:hypothetical protein